MYCGLLELEKLDPSFLGIFAPRTSFGGFLLCEVADRRAEIASCAWPALAYASASVPWKPRVLGSRAHDLRQRIHSAWLLAAAKVTRLDHPDDLL